MATFLKTDAIKSFDHQLQLHVFIVTVIVMEVAENPEAIWIVQVVAPTEIHMMVTVRYTSFKVKN